MATAFTEKIYQIVRTIPCGKVATYGQIAFLAGNPRGARGVGFALHRNPQPGVIPCHRVVFKDGSLCSSFAFGGKEIQRQMLENEQVTFLKDGRVDLKRHLWTP